MNYKADTLCIHGGYEPKNGEPRVMPIVQSTTFKYDSSEDMGNLFDLKEAGFFYTRLGNPTNDAVEKKIAAMEGGVGALITSSGQAASLFSVLNLCKCGDHVVSTSAIYGGTFNLFYKTMKEMGIEFSFVSPKSTRGEILAACNENTKCVFTETLSNPSLVVADLEALADAAHSVGVPLIVDNTFPTPINCNPFKFGADIIIHSTTKYMDGHASQVGGVIIDGGTFDFTRGKFPAFTEPDESYHGLVYTEAFGNMAYIIKARTHLMRDIGAQASPMNAFLLNMGLETLALRMERHCDNALKVARYLKAHPEISWVSFPQLEDDAEYEMAKKYMPKGTCGVVSFGIKKGREAAAKFMDNLKLASIATHVADLKTCVLHPAGTTHRQLTDDQLKEAGVSPDLIRLSVGIENSGDIIEDLENALSVI